jgi:hypothetical protein
MVGTGRKARLGAYGLHLHGLDEAAHLLHPVARDAPVFGVFSEVGTAREGAEYVDDDRAVLALRSGGEIVVERAAGVIRFRVPHAVRADELVHPYLAPAAAVAARWLGRESMHAGAFVAGGRAWALLGDRTAGKSSTLGWLARLGTPVICDDMLIVERGRVFAGPRSLDLREDAAARIDGSRAIGVAGARERWRVELGAVPESLELGGWFLLEWGDDIAVRALRPSERLARLAPHRALRLEPARSDAVLELASLPARVLSRPRRWESLPESAERLLEIATSTATGAA